MTVTIKSSQSDAAIVFTTVELDYFTVELRGSEVSAVRQVWGYTDCALLVDLLNHLARQSNGWKDIAEWQSIESDLTLGFNCDSCGHVFVTVQMRCQGTDEDWQVKATIQTELGQLPRIAAEAGEFFEGQ